MQKNENALTDVPHTWSLHHFNRPTWCTHCGKFIWGIGKQGYKCKMCKFPAHKECHKQISTGCTGKSPSKDSVSKLELKGPTNDGLELQNNPQHMFAMHHFNKPTCAHPGVFSVMNSFGVLESKVDVV
eukprot:TRINITY_DN17902_c0_g1_i1.p1 TRINITY_DN17902_c0_g1~~TRINITY_DN17902_c0_g1_i1.p1  ORF type:complete len:137 (+),score=1.22 TRINITY_DN17902_c0_g1_i1:30-413(+)